MGLTYLSLDRIIYWSENPRFNQRSVTIKYCKITKNKTDQKGSDWRQKSELRWYRIHPWEGSGGVRYPNRSLLRPHPNIHRRLLRLRPCSSRIEFPCRSESAGPGAGPGFGCSHRWARCRLSAANHLISESRSPDLFFSFSFWSSLTKWIYVHIFRCKLSIATFLFSTFQLTPVWI